jgi:predicted nucleic acid-binding Zn ribbon protein
VDKNELSYFKRRLSKVNELRRLFWTELRTLRKDFLSRYPAKDFKEDPQWQEIRCSLNDMWESTFKEDMRRKTDLPRKDLPHLPRPAGGLYANERRCVVCDLPLIGRQKSYCSEICRNISKGKRFRAADRERYRKIQAKYYKTYYPDE